MAVIYSFSTSGFSSGFTGSVIDDLVLGVLPDTSQVFLFCINYIVRKLAHLAEYAVLGLLLYRAFVKGPGLASGRAVIVSIAVWALFAASDEFHQLLVPGRSARVMDVVFDASGAAIALLTLRLRHKKAHL